MGIGSETRNITVFSNAMPISMDTPSLNDLVVHATLTHQSVPEVLMNTYAGGLHKKVDKARTWAKAFYPLGLPDSNTMVMFEPNNTELEAAITDSLSLPNGCVVDSTKTDELNIVMILYPYLTTTRGLELRSNFVFQDTLQMQISVLPDDWVLPKLYDGQLIVYSPPMVQSYSLLADKKTIQITYQAVLKYADIVNSMTFTDVPTDYYDDTYIEEYEIPANLIIGNSYCMAAYYELDAGGIPADTLKWWYYAIDSGVYDENLIVTDVLESAGYPVVPIRYERAYINEIDNEALYTAGKKLLNKIDLSFDDIVSNLDSNPDVHEIDHAYVMFGVDLQSNNQTVLKYLITYFTQLAAVPTIDMFDKMLNASEGNWYRSGVAQVQASPYLVGYENIAEYDLGLLYNMGDITFTEYGLDLLLTWSTLSVTTETGSIGEVGTITKEITGLLSSSIIPAADIFSSPTRDYQYYKRGTLWLREQISANRYTQVKLTDPVHRNTIYKSHAVMTNLGDVDGSEDEHNFILPLHYAAVMKMPISLKNELFNNAINLIVNGYEDTHVQWYETPEFTFGLTATLTLLSFGTIGPAFSAGVSALTYVGVNVVVSQLLMMLLITASLQVTAVSKLFGEEAAVTVGILNLVTSSYAAFGTAAARATLTTAKAIIFATSVTLNITNQVLNKMIKDVYAEYEEFTIDAEAKMEILNAKKELLDKEYLIPFSYLQDPGHVKPDIKTKPERFYDKIHVGNIGTLTLDMIESYVDRNLILPE